MHISIYIYAYTHLYIADTEGALGAEGGSATSRDI